MRFRTSLRLMQQPDLYGGTLARLPSCHEFSVSDVTIDYKKVDYYSNAECEVTLVSGKFGTSGSLYGPASLIKDRTIIYPCDTFRCRIGCACHLCRRGCCICTRAAQDQTCGDCAECRFDCEDHLVFHRAPHMNCKFCLNALEHIPHLEFVIRQVRGNYPDWHDVRISASLFRHVLKDIKVVKDECSRFACDKCSKTFNKIGDLKKHEVSVHYGEKHECEYCGVKFSRHDNLRDHIEIFHTENCHKYECELCMKYFTKKSHFVRHRKVSHTCKSCLAVICTTNQLQVHKKIDHPEYPCGHCQRSFQDRANMKRHTGSSHNENGTWKNYCEICTIGFCSFLDLARHNKIHPKVCKVCGKTFKTNWSLKVHMMKREEKPCTKCGKILCNKNDMKIHVNRIHNQKQCKICSERIFTKYMKHHMYSVHQQVIEGSE